MDTNIIMNSTKNVYCDYCDALEGAEYYRDYYSNYYVEYYLSDATQSLLTRAHIVLPLCPCARFLTTQRQNSNHTLLPLTPALLQALTC